MKFESKKSLLTEAAARAKVDSQYDVTESLLVALPFREQKTSAFHRVAAYIERLENVTGTKAHTTILAFDGENWWWWCADSFLAGKYSARERDEALKVATTKAEEAQMRGLYGRFKDTGCGFWKHGGEHCKHTDNMCASITEEMLEQLEALFHGEATVKKKGRRSPKEFIEKRMFKKHVKLEGPKGGGKTYLARTIAKEHADVVINIAGSEKVDSAELEGHLVPHAERVASKGQGGLFESNETVIQTFIFKYGRLARGFRAAAAGKKVIVVIDEMYRIPPEQMQLLVTALSPFEGHYILPISNMVESEHEWEDGLVEEELRAPVENLMVIGTTNVGANYIVDGIDEALQDRFHTVQVPEDAELIESVVKERLAKRGFKPHCKSKILSFLEKMKRLQLDKQITREINLRHIAEIIDVAVDEDDLAETAFEMHTQWASLIVDGVYDPIEVKMIEKVIEASFA